MDKAMKVTREVYKQSKNAEQESKEYSIPNTKDEEKEKQEARSKKQDLESSGES